MFDLQTNYPNTKYNPLSNPNYGATIYSGGCCPTSVGNILRNYIGISDATTANICKLAISSKARYEGGTYPKTLLDACIAKYGKFTYKYTNSDSEMKSHIKNGGMALAHTSGSSGGSTPLFSNGGHFISIIGINNDGTKIKVCDPYYYSGKWTQNSVRSNNITTTDTKGVVFAKYPAVCSAIDYYYLIIKKTTDKKITIKENCNIRKSNNSESKLLGSLNKGSKLVLVSETDNWIESYGYVPMTHCSISNSTVKITNKCNIRYSNSSESNLIGTMNDGVVLKLIEKTKNWAKVQFYIPKKYIK